MTYETMVEALIEAEQLVARVLDEVVLIETRSCRRSTHHLGQAVFGLRTARVVLEGDSKHPRVPLEHDRGAFLATGGSRSGAKFQMPRSSATSSYGLRGNA